MIIMIYETIIGLEVHVQLHTRSKMFCSCSADYAGAEPNTHVCPICLGMPGVLPTINMQAIEYAVTTALALNCTIPEFTKFDRKNYPYPDLMKGYQISQYDAPLSHDGWLTIDVDGEEKRIGITRVHLEEDTAKLIHRTDPWGETYSLVDVNRAGVPLMEVVSEPDLRSAEEARQYLIKLHTILQYLGVTTGKMEEGSYRVDTNVSIRPSGSRQFLGKVEVKNLNSFRAVYRALLYEVERQKKVVEEGGRIPQETRGWVEEEGVTVSQRSKEYAHDYRYFPEPDLPPLVFSRAWVEELRSRLPELPDARRERFMTQYGLPAYDAVLLTGSKALADFFDECVKVSRARATTSDQKRRAKAISNWVLGELARLLKATDAEIGDSKITPQHLAEMLDLIDQGTISSTMAKALFEEMFNTGKYAGEIATREGLTQISDVSQVEGIVEQVLRMNEKAVADFKAGKEQSLKFLVGQVMKETRGRANPQLVNEVLRQRLEMG
ncbi:MAG: glutaminyl-tRNA synthase (glutamine-hydrolyzing) subunit B [Chloroflexi bacterium RBG_13_54_9]|nr:MAG: glutaminyl-tRNA synthase (glutamine-hydrolyzing) subunit B [Chloroflexi bacterium RBG_13_54_9]